MIEEFGGFYLDFNNNLLNPDVLEHVLVEIESVLFGQELYPEIIQKAGVLPGGLMQDISSMMVIKEPA
jgi:hypothetical protein